MRRATKLGWLGLGVASSCIALACAGNNATIGASSDPGRAGSAGTMSSAGTAASSGVTGSSEAAGATGRAGPASEAPCAANDFAGDSCNSCACSDTGLWDCKSFDCAQSECPAARPSTGTNCALTATFAKDPTGGTCCPYANTCAAPDGWARFASASACMGIDGGGCPAGFSDCNQSKQDGCETRTPGGTTCANACAAEPTVADAGSASSGACPGQPCPAGMVCVVEVGGVAGGGGARCEPIAASCGGQPSCACMKYCSCTGGFGSRPESCGEQAGVIYCDNGVR